MSDQPPPGAPPALTPEELKARDSRNRALGWALAGLVVLFFVVSVVQLTLGSGISERM